MAFGEHDRDLFAEAFGKMGFSFVEAACLFHYVDAPLDFVIGGKWVVRLDAFDGGVWEEVLRWEPEYASARWKGELMFYAGAQMAFAAGSVVLCSDFCSN